MVGDVKAPYAVLLALVLGVGCGEKAASEPEQAKGSSKPALPDSKNSQPKPPPKKKTPQPKPEPKFDPTKHERFLWEFETRDDVASSPAIGSDGTVYVGSADKKLYAIKTDSKGLAKSPWPMRGQNARHTGRAPTK